jgi:hypothetical protein
MNKQYLHHIHSPVPSSTSHTHTLVPTPWAVPVLPPVLWFWKKEKWQFCLFKINMQGISMYICIITCLGSSRLLFFLL